MSCRYDDGDVCDVVAMRVYLNPLNCSGYSKRKGDTCRIF